MSSMMTSSNGNISALPAICADNSPVTGEFPAHWPVTWSFDVFFDLRLNKRLSKQSWGRWLRRHRAHYDVIIMHWMRKGFGDEVATSHWLNKWWPSSVTHIFGTSVHELRHGDLMMHICINVLVKYQTISWTIADAFSIGPLEAYSWWCLSKNKITFQ